MKHSSLVSLSLGLAILVCIPLILYFGVYGSGPRSLHALPDLFKHVVAICVSGWLGYHAISIIVLGLDGIGMVALPKLWYLLQLRIFAVLNLNVQLKADYFARISRLVSRQFESNRSVVADLKWMDKFLEHHLPNDMNRGMTTDVEKLCDRILEIEENESTRICWSIKRQVLQKTNRAEELALIERASNGAIDGKRGLSSL